MSKRQDVNVLGSGVDIVEVQRIRGAVDRWGDTFLNKIFTARELNYAQEKKIPHQHLAARFAAKEAIAKAFGDGRAAYITWQNVEVANDTEGKPYVILRGKAEEERKERGIVEVLLSMSHTKEYAVANALLIGDGNGKKGPR